MAGRSRVRVPPRSGSRWEQVRLALRSAALARDDGTWTDAPLLVTHLQREYGERLELRRERVLGTSVGVGRPFGATDPDSLARVGYVVRDSDDSFRFRAPDEAVLLSDSFQSTHCFGTPAQDTVPGVAELRFVPLQRGRLPGIEGSAFIDTASGEPRAIDFRYVVPPGFFPAPTPHAGGRIEMRRLPSGRWIVAAWHIRMPLFASVGLNARPRVVGYREVGGRSEEVARAAPNVAGTPRPPDSVVVSLTVVDPGGDRVAGVGAQVDSVQSPGVSDSSGQLRVVVGAQVPLRVLLRRVGLVARDVTLPPLARDTAFRVTMARLQVLPTVTVEARGPLEVIGFTKRRMAGFGRFIDSLEIRRRGSINAIDLLQGTQGLRLFRVPQGSLPPSDDVELGKEWVDGAVLPMMDTPTNIRGGGGLCLPLFYVDARRATLAEYRFLSSDDVIAVEIYRRASDVPAEYARLQVNFCGTVLIWTRDLPVPHPR